MRSTAAVCEFPYCSSGLDPGHEERTQDMSTASITAHLVSQLSLASNRTTLICLLVVAGRDRSAVSRKPRIL